MKLAALLVIAISVSSCGVLNQRSYVSSKERLSNYNRDWTNATKPNLSEGQVIDLLGEPDEMEFDGPNRILTIYRATDLVPFKFTFNEGRLKSVIRDDHAEAMDESRDSNKRNHKLMNQGNWVNAINGMKR